MTIDIIGILKEINEYWYVSPSPIVSDIKNNTRLRIRI